MNQVQTRIHRRLKQRFCPDLQPLLLGVAVGGDVTQLSHFDFRPSFPKIIQVVLMRSGEDGARSGTAAADLDGAARGARPSCWSRRRSLRDVVRLGGPRGSTHGMRSGTNDSTSQLTVVR